MTGPFAVILRRSGAGWDVIGLWKPRARPNATYSARSKCWHRERTEAVKSARVMGLR